MKALATLIPLSALCGIVIAYVFRRFSGSETKQTVNRILAYLMELRLFIDEPRVVWKTQRSLLRENLRLFGQIAIPSLITIPLIALVMWQADAVYGHGPLRPGEAVVVTAPMNGRLQAPPEIKVESPGVRIPQSQEVSWRIRPVKPFSGSLGQNVTIPWPRASILGISWLVWFFAISTLFAFIRWPKGTLTVLLLIHSAKAADRTPVILISVDTLRADHVTATRTPGLASIGTIYPRLDSQIPLTLPSHTVLMTSTYPFANHVEANDEAVPADAVTLASILRANGYKTAAFVGSAILDKRFGLDKGFDVYDSPFGATRVRRDAALVTRAALQWTTAHKSEPVFVFLHLYDLHTPYTQIPGLTPNPAGYDAELQYVDRTVARLRESLGANGFWDKALVILVADHGESLGDHGETSHGFFIYESTMHVPLIVHWPAGVQKLEPGGLIDIAPTILDFLHIPRSPSFAGVSLLSGREHETYGESIYPQENFGWAALHSLQSGPFKYIEAPRPELYDLLKDPGERTNILAAHADQAKLIKQKLDALMAKYATPQKQSAPEISAQTKAVLGSLGYTSGHQTAQALPADPKDKIAEQEAFETGLTFLYSGRYDQAIVTLQKIVKQDPKNVAALSAAGEAYLRSGSTDKALTTWQQVLERDPKNRTAADSMERACKFKPDAPPCRAH